MDHNAYDPLPEPPPRREPSSRRPPAVRIAAWIGGALGLALLTIVGLRVWRAVDQRAVAPPAAATNLAGSSSSAGAAAGAAPAAAAARPIVPLPALAASDDRVRELLAHLSAREELGRWLIAADDLVRRATAAITAVSEGASPRGSLTFLAPDEPFAVYERDGRTYIDQSSWARYDALTAVVVSLDTIALAAVIRELLPLFEEAFAEIAYPGRRFETALAEAIRHLRATPVEARREAGRTPREELAINGRELEVRRQGALWVYVDADREALSAAQKHLLRMGPRNALLIQAKLAELSAALALETTPGH